MQAAAVHTQVWKGAFSKRNNNNNIKKRTETLESVCKKPSESRVDALASQSWLHWEEMAAHLGNMLHVGPFAVCNQARRAANYLLHLSELEWKSHRRAGR